MPITLTNINRFSKLFHCWIWQFVYIPLYNFVLCNLAVYFILLLKKIYLTWLDLTWQQSISYIAHHTLTVLLHLRNQNCQFCYFASAINPNAVISGHENKAHIRRPWHVPDVLLKHEMLPDIRAISGDFFIFSRRQCTHRPIGLVRRSRYCSERFRLSLLPICGLPTALTSTLLTTRCGVQCRTKLIGRRCETLTIWSGVWLTCETVWSKTSSMTRSTSGVYDFVPVSMQKGGILNSLCNLHLNFVIKWHLIVTVKLHVLF